MGGYVVACAVSFLVGVIVNELITHLLMLDGILRIDKHSAEKDLYRFELNNLDVLDKKRFVVLKIDKKAKLSQE